MPHYDFENGQGQRVERFFSMSQVPDSIEHEGQTYRRIISGGVISNAVEVVTQKYPYVSLRHARWKPGAGGYTKDGKPIITSQRNEREFMARHNLDRE